MWMPTLDKFSLQNIARWFTNVHSMIGFYESQLIFLTAVCLLTLTLERYASNLAANNNHKRLSKDLDRVDTGHLKGRSLLAALTRQYLVVYAIVMGECLSLSFNLEQRQSDIDRVAMHVQVPTGYKDPTYIPSTESNTSIQRDLSPSYSSLGSSLLGWQRHW
jgi:hypothetical protein